MALTYRKHAVQDFQVASLRLESHILILSLIEIFYISSNLPLYFLVKNVGISSIVGSECFSTILYAQHQKRFGTIIANRTLACWRNSYYASFLNIEYFTINLEFAVTTKEEIQFFVILVSMKKTNLCARSKALE